MLKRSRAILASIFLPLFALGTLVLVFILYLPSQAANATYTVNSTADTDDGNCNAANCTLREAVLAANGTPDADTIVFSIPPNSTITLNGNQLPIITGTLTIDGSTAVNLTISGNHASRLFVIGQLPPPYPRPDDPLIENEIGATAVVTLTNLTLRDGLDNFGGGISNSGLLTIIDSTVTRVKAYRGGIFNNNTLIISNTTFFNNNITTGASAGAGIFNTGQGTVNIMSSSFISNSVRNYTAIGGGAIYNESGTLTVTDSVFEGNYFYGNGAYGDGGGAIGQEFDSANSIYIENSMFISNTSELGGGALWIPRSQPVRIKNSTFTGNTAEDGGAIWGASVNGINIQESEFTLNSAEQGGAIHSVYHLTITNSIFSDNSADLEGGAVNIETNSGIDSYMSGSTFINNTSINGGAIDYYSIAGDLLLRDSTFVGNTADEGGAVNVNDIGTVIVTNSSLTGNSADLGGAFFGSGFLGLNNSTLSGNSASTAGAGVYNEGTFNIRNTIIANSVTGVDCVNVGTLNVNVNNMVEDGTCNPLLTGDPVLGPLQDNGGNTWTHALLIGSPAIDAGDPATCANAPVNNLDQRGQIRPVDGDGDGMAVCDIGAYEAEPALNISKSGPALAAAGEYISYDLVIVNNLPVNLTNVVVTDTVPLNATYISGGTLIGNVVSWLVPELTSGSSLTRSFVVTATQTITNDDYRVSAGGGYSATGTTAVVTIVLEPITGLTASNDSPTTAGSPTNLMATITSGSDVIYTWDFGDGTTGSGATVSHTYPGVGQYTAVVTATNAVDEAEASTQVTIVDIEWKIYLPSVLRDEGNTQQPMAKAPDP